MSNYFIGYTIHTGGAMRGTRLPEDWRPDSSDLTWAAERGYTDSLDWQLEEEKFRDYWLSQPGQRGVKLDWQRTWRNWIRNAVQWKKERDARSRRDQSGFWDATYNGGWE